MAAAIEDVALKTRTQSLVHVALALALVIAQFIAQAHGYSHLRAGGEQRGSATQQCGECLANSALVSGADVPVHALAFFGAPDAAPPVIAQKPLVERFRPRPFQPRAPPA